MQKRFKKLFTGFIASTLAISNMMLTVFADEPYEVYNYDTWGEAVPSQAGYLAEKSISGEDFDIEHFS